MLQLLIMGYTAVSITLLTFMLDMFSKRSIEPSAWIFILVLFWPWFLVYRIVDVIRSAWPNK